MADVLVLLNPLDISRRRRTHLGDEVLLLDWVDTNEPALGACERQVYVNGHPCTDPTYRTHAHDEVLVAFTPGAGINIGLVIAQAIVSMAIGAALSYMFGPKRPAAGNMPQPSQVYGIAPPRNAARLGQPIPAIYGSVITLPDFAAQPYTYFDQNDQWMHALLCVGLGEFDVSEMLFADSSGAPLAADVVQWRAFLPGDHGSRFGIVQGQTGVRENVVTSPAVGTQELFGQKESGVWVQSTWYWALSNVTTAGAPAGVNLIPATTPAAKLLLLPTAPALGTAVAVTLSFDGATYRLGTYTAAAYVSTQIADPGALIPAPVFDTTPGNRWIGPFECCKTGQTGTSIELDFVFPKGLWGSSAGSIANASVIVQVVWEKIDTSGAVVAGGGSLNLTLGPRATTTPQRMTHVQAVASGRYRVKIANLINGGGDNINAGLQVIWAGLKFQLDPLPAARTIYGNVTLIAVKLKASNGVASDASASMRFRVTRRLPPLGVGTAVATVNPADAFVDVVTAAYGGARPVNGDELDLAELTASRAQWVGHNGFNGIFDQPSTVWEALSLCVQTVHAAPLPVGSRMSLIHDGVQPVRSQLFTDANIVAGSLGVTCQFDQTGTPQGVRVNYRDPRTFSPVALLDPTESPDYITVDLFGCTSASVAQEHADLTTARRRLQRKIIEFATELEGLNVLPGDRIGVQAGMVAWAQGARVERMTGRTLTLDNALVWTPAATHAVQLRDPFGMPVRVVGVTRGATDHELVLPVDAPLEITGTIATQEATAIAFGVQDAEVTDWTVSKVTPSGDTVTIEAANYDPAIYTAAAAFTRGEALA